MKCISWDALFIEGFGLFHFAVKGCVVCCTVSQLFTCVLVTRLGRVCSNCECVVRPQTTRFLFTALFACRAVWVCSEHLADEFSQNVHWLISGSYCTCFFEALNFHMQWRVAWLTYWRHPEASILKEITFFFFFFNEGFVPWKALIRWRARDSFAIALSFKHVFENNEWHVYHTGWFKQEFTQATIQSWWEHQQAYVADRQCAPGEFPCVFQVIIEVWRQHNLLNPRRMRCRSRKDRAKKNGHTVSPRSHLRCPKK